MLNRFQDPARRVLAVAEAVTRRALDNAAAAADALQRDNRDRSALRPSSDKGSTSSPGELTRLSREECLRLLRTRHVGRLAYVARTDTPDLVPVNYSVDDDGRIIVRSGPGPKLLAAQRQAPVAFEVDDIDEAAHTGWSVVVMGRAELAPRDGQRSDEFVQPWAAGPRNRVIRITPRRIEGRRLN